MNPEQICNLAESRKTFCGSEQARMDRVRRIYNGDETVDLPELQANEEVTAANLTQLGIDQMAMRVASVFPAVSFSTARNSDTERNKARDKRDVMLNWWKTNRLTTHILPRRARWYFGFSAAPVMIRPGMDGLPRWYDRHPIGCYPSAVTQAGDIVPENVVFTFKKSSAELKRDYPEQMWRICGCDWAQMKEEYEVLEYVDADQITCIVVGPPNEPFLAAKGTPYELLYDLPNRAGRPLAVVPGRVTLDKPLGQFDGIVSQYQYQARMMALYMIAMERSIFPETWVYSTPGLPRAKIITPADPIEGIVGEIEGGSIQTINPAPSPMVGQMVDRLEYNERASGAIPAEFSGHSSSNIRTGRRGDAVMGAAVDYRLQEAQQIFEASLEEENRIAIAVAKSYSTKQFSFYVQGRGKVSYTSSVFDGDDDHEVRYAYAGADANAITIAVGQKLGLETISRQTAMELDPMVRDVESEMDRIRVESLGRAFWSSVQAQAADPNGPYQPRDLAALGKKIQAGMNEFDALAELDEEIRKRQEEQARQQAQGAEAQPGLSMPGAPGSPVPPNVQDVGPSIGNLSQMLTQLRRPQMQLASERQPIAQPAVA